MALREADISRRGIVHDWQRTDQRSPIHIIERSVPRPEQASNDTHERLLFLRAQYDRLLNEQLATNEARKLNRLRPWNRCLQRLEIIQGLDLTNTYDQARSTALLTQLAADFQKAANYKSISKEKKAEYYHNLIQTIRQHPGFTQGQATEWLVSLRNIGSEATTAILDSLQKQAWEWRDLSPERQYREAEKAHLRVKPDQKNWTDADYVHVKAMAKRAAMQKAEVSFGFNEGVAFIDRDMYMGMAQHFIPSSIAPMVGRNVTARELVTNIKYDAVCKAAQPLLPATANPYR
jgi:hypothetical protein